MNINVTLWFIIKEASLEDYKWILPWLEFYYKFSRNQNQNIRISLEFKNISRRSLQNTKFDVFILMSLELWLYIKKEKEKNERFSCIKSV